MKIRKLYDMPKEKKEKTPVYGNSRTQQHFKDECDVNRIVEKYKATGYLVDPLIKRTVQPMYGDFCNLPDFMEAQLMIRKANEGFEALPAFLRKRFNNDPREFVEFCSNPENRTEMEKLGLIERQEVIPATVPPVPLPEDPEKAE